MKIWKSVPVPVSADDALAAVRLGAVTGRGKTEASSYEAEATVPDLEKVSANLRRFWSPHELAKAANA